MEANIKYNMNKVHVITGSGGIGLATAVELGKSGKIILADTSEKSLKNVCAYLDKLGISAEGVLVDVTDRNSVQMLFEKAQSFGEVESVVNTAGISMACGDIGKIININVMGVINVTDLALPVLKAGGALVNISSAAAYNYPLSTENIDTFKSVAAKSDGALDAMQKIAGDPDIAYSVSKRFVIYYSKCRIRDYAAKNCRINSVAPSNTKTEMLRQNLQRNPEMFDQALQYTPLRRFGCAYETAALIEFLVSSRASYITGVDVLCDGGLIGQLEAQ